MAKTRNSPPSGERSEIDMPQFKVDVPCPSCVSPANNSLDPIIGGDTSFPVTVILSSNPINWKSKINPKHIVLKQDEKDKIEKKYGKEFWSLQKEIQEGRVDFKSIEEFFILIKLSGWRELAELRGYKSVSYEVYNPSPEYCAVKCTITWKNEDGSLTEFSSLADSHLGNTLSFAQNFLSAISENRAFCRAVRNFLNISIVSVDEMGPKVEEKTKVSVNANITPQQTLKNVALEVLKVDNFEKFKDFLRAERKAGNVSFDEQESKSIKEAADIDDLPPMFCLSLITLVKSKAV